MAKAVDKHLIISYIYSMKEKKVTISSKDISTKQWSTLLLELNLLIRAWKSYATLEMKAPNLKKVLGWGLKKYDEK